MKTDIEKAIAYANAIVDDLNREQRTEAGCKFAGVTRFDDMLKVYRDVEEPEDDPPPLREWDVCLRGVATAAYVVEAEDEQAARELALEEAGCDTDKWSTPDWEIESVEERK